MKKRISMLLALVMCFSLCACGGGANKEDMVASAQRLDLLEIIDKVNSNEAAAKELYEGKTFIKKVSVGHIYEDCFEYVIESYGNISSESLKIYMPSSELVELDGGQELIVVGTLTDVTGVPKLIDAFNAEPYGGKIEFSEDELTEAIEEFGYREWTDGSYPFFRENKINFEKIDSESFFTELAGNWKAKDAQASGTNTAYDIVIENDTIYEVEKSGEIDEWTYRFSGDEFYRGRNPYPLEVIKVSDNLIAFYCKAYGDNVSMILYKE